MNETNYAYVAPQAFPSSHLFYPHLKVHMHCIFAYKPIKPLKYDQNMFYSHYYNSLFILIM